MKLFSLHAYCKLSFLYPPSHSNAIENGGKIFKNPHKNKSLVVGRSAPSNQQGSEEILGMAGFNSHSLAIDSYVVMG